MTKGTVTHRWKFPQVDGFSVIQRTFQCEIIPRDKYIVSPKLLHQRFGTTILLNPDGQRSSSCSVCGWGTAGADGDLGLFATVDKIEPVHCCPFVIYLFPILCQPNHIVKILKLGERKQ